jgi:hypothetical protein
VGLSSSTFAEVFVQYMEHKQLYPILLKYKVTGYFRYIGDILIIYNQKRTNVDETVAKFSKQRPSIKYSVAKKNSTTTLISCILQYGMKKQK